jgi:threonyl-tRNA synthetase
MIHRAPFGSMERFIGVLIEHTAGKFPIWLAPDQYTILPVSDQFNSYAHQVHNRLQELGYRGFIDSRNETIGKKIRENEIKRIPFMLIVGEKEVTAEQVSVRRQGKGDVGSMTLMSFAALIDSMIN